MENLRDLLCQAFLAARWDNQDKKDYRDFDKWFDQNQSKFENIMLWELIPENKIKDSRVLKLDKNFHVYVHGDKDKLETCSDEIGNYLKLRYEVCH